jgi:orotate phosphoribosyltransferase
MELARMRENLKGLLLSATHQGPVTLASGAVSEFYIDGRQVTLKPEGLYYCAHLMAAMLKDTKFEAVGGPSIGADPIVGALCFHLYSVDKKTVTGFLIRKSSKEHGLQKLIEGPELKAGARVVVIEDVVTSGGSALKAIGLLEERGCRVVKTLALVDREEGAADALGPFGFEPVFTKSQLL